MQTGGKNREYVKCSKRALRVYDKINKINKIKADSLLPNPKCHRYVATPLVFPTKYWLRASNLFNPWVFLICVVNYFAPIQLPEVLRVFAISSQTRLKVSIFQNIKQKSERQYAKQNFIEISCCWLINIIPATTLFPTTIWTFAW